MIERPRTKKPERRPLSRSTKIALSLLVIILAASGLRVFVCIPYHVNSPAMQNGLYDGDCIWISKAAYKTSVPRVGDLVLFEHPLHPGQKIVRRVIATEGQKVEIKEKKVYINDSPIAELPSVQHFDYRILPQGFSNRDNFPAQRVPGGQIFVLGDNRDQSDDSRNFGFVPVNTVEGKGLFVYFSWKPDPKAPKLKSPYITPAIHIFFYNLININNRLRWDRLFISSK
jgi:signal peptidase I